MAILRVDVRTPHYNELAARLCREPWMQGTPASFGCDERMEVPANWHEILATAPDDTWAFWMDARQEVARGFSRIPRSELLLITVPVSDEMDLRGRIELVESWQLVVAAIDSPHQDAWLEKGYFGWGFGRGMLGHGIATIFRGAGHDRLVSRRWLDHGPWRVIRRPNDTTVIQFHAEDADAETSYAQAKVGHQRMGIDPIGGYIQGIDEVIITTVGGLYDEALRRLEVVVAPGLSVSQQDMRVACALRLHRRLTRSPDRIDTLAYVFLDRADAEAHLHELWLRELECWYVDGDGKHRLDADYHPVPNPPDWVRAIR